ncbi:MAG: vitamin K epoxide reductase family protein [Phycisphaerales bacterium]
MIPRRGWLICARLFAVLAACISSYLLYVELVQASLPAGCGGGSGCAAVLTSRFAGTFRIPVSLPALAMHVLSIVATIVAVRGSGLGRFLLVFTAASVALAAAWFVVVQLFILKSICPWCMADHACGMGYAFAVAVALLPRRNAETETAGPRTPSALVATVAAILGVAVLIAGQYVTHYQPKAIAHLPGGSGSDVRGASGRELVLLDGTVTLRVSELPMIGSPDAERIVIVLLDYCCPHCRRTHGYLREMIANDSAALAAIILPAPRDSDCNPTIEETESRFRDACELAALALAVWQIDRAPFGDFEDWLFGPEMPRTIEEALAHAADLLHRDRADLDAALADPWIAARIKSNIEIYTASGADRIPVILQPGRDTIVGAPEDADALRNVLLGSAGSTED